MPKTEKITTAKESIRKMREMMDSGEPRAVRWMKASWLAQRSDIADNEIVEAVGTGEISPKWADRFHKRYATFVNEKLEPEWRKAAAAGAGVVQDGIANLGIGHEWDFLGSRIDGFVLERANRLPVQLTEEQMKALKSVLYHYTVDEPIASTELARMIKPVVGLTERDSGVLIKLRTALTAEGALSPLKILEAVERRARHLHNVRALRIARTELAFSYNSAARAAAQDVAAEVPGTMLRRWYTQHDSRVDPHICVNLDGELIPLDGLYPGGYDGPPAHPNCRCLELFEYEEAVTQPEPVVEPVEPIEQPTWEATPGDKPLTERQFNKSHKETTAEINKRIPSQKKAETDDEYTRRVEFEMDRIRGELRHNGLNLTDILKPANNLSAEQVRRFENESTEFFAHVRAATPASSAELKRYYADELVVKKTRSKFSIGGSWTCENGKCEIEIPFNDNSIKTVFHELSHSIEQGNGRILDASRLYYEQRTRGETEVTYGGDENMKYRKGFWSKYAGVRYADGGGYETLSTGMEFFTSKERMAALYKADPSHFNFCLGVARGRHGYRIPDDTVNWQHDPRNETR